MSRWFGLVLLGTMLSALPVAFAQDQGLRGELERVPADAQKAQDDADAIKSELDKHEKAHLDAEQERRRLEGDLQTERSNLRKWQTRLDEIRDEREHNALLSEMGSQKRGIRAIENKILVLLMVQSVQQYLIIFFRAVYRSLR